MDRLETTYRQMQTLSIAAAVVLAQASATWVEHQTKWFSHLFVLMIVAVGYRVFRLILESAFDSFAWLRRIMLKRQFIEGTWLEITREHETPIAIATADSKIHVSGEDYNIDSIHCGQYVADMLVVRWPRIKYKYSYQS